MGNGVKITGLHYQRGFTLIEVMITVAIVGILSAIAYPSYAAYILRGKMVEASTNLLSVRTAMEQYYQDNRGYANVSAAIVSPCDSTKMPVMKNFTMTCAIGTPASGYTATAAGSNASTTGFSFAIDNAGNQTSTMGTLWGGGSYACWIMKKGAVC